CDGNGEQSTRCL
ncbi:unnamed protein product, partial [Hermetia illucens]